MSEHDHETPGPRPRHDSSVLGGAAALFHALADVERLRLLDLLAAGERCVSEIATASQAAISTVSQRLKVLSSEGLVSQRRDGKHIYYRLADAHVVELIESALAHANHNHAGNGNGNTTTNGKANGQ